jgi:hypothetical protein
MEETKKEENEVKGKKNQKNCLVCMFGFVKLCIEISDYVTDLLELKQTWELSQTYLDNHWYLALMTILLISIFSPYLIAYGSAL